jgi:Bacterial regulatory protein, arsR family
MPRPRQQRSSEPRGLDLAVSGLDQAVAVLDAEIGTLETQLKDKRDERRELQRTRTRLTKLGGNRSTAAAARAATGRRARTRTTPSAPAASAAAAAASSPRRPRRRSSGRAPTAEREAAIIEAISRKPMTAVETARAVGLSRPRARQILKQLRDSGRLRVEEDSSGRGRPRLVYRAGPNG